MKALKPILIVTVGPALLAITVGVVLALVLPEARTVSSVGWMLMVGAVMGLTIFGSIAGALVLRQRKEEWSNRHRYRIEWFASMAMALAAGYLLGVGSSAHDSLVLVACLAMFLGAVLKVALRAAW